MEILFNIAISAALISLTLWLSRTNPTLGGFIISLPISTLIVLALSKVQNKDPQTSIALAKSIFVGIPASLMFFIPFLLAGKMKLSFWQCYGAGFVLLGFGYFAHKHLAQYLTK